MTEQNKALQTTGNNLPTVATGAQYIAHVLEETKREFLAFNQGLDLDFVRMGDYMKIDAKGNFIDARDPSISFGDKIDVVIAQGEQRWSLWGEEGTPEDGQMLVAEKTETEAHAKFAELLQVKPELAERYSFDDIKLRYLAVVVPVATLAPGEFPQIYMLPSSPSDSYAVGHYAMSLFKGKYKAAGVPARTPLNAVVTRVETESRSNGTNRWLGVKHSVVGMFKPEDYGLDPNVGQATAGTAAAEDTAATE